MTRRVTTYTPYLPYPPAINACWCIIINYYLSSGNRRTISTRSGSVDRAAVLNEQVIITHLVRNDISSIQRHVAMYFQHHSQQGTDVIMHYSLPPHEFIDRSLWDTKNLVVNEWCRCTTDPSVLIEEIKCESTESLVVKGPGGQPTPWTRTKTAVESESINLWDNQQDLLLFFSFMKVHPPFPRWVNVKYNGKSFFFYFAVNILIYIIHSNKISLHCCH